MSLNAQRRRRSQRRTSSSAVSLAALAIWSGRTWRPKCAAYSSAYSFAVPTHSGLSRSSLVHLPHPPTMCRIMQARGEMAGRRAKTVMPARYGPREEWPRDINKDFFKDQKSWEEADAERSELQEQQFRALLIEVINAESPQALSSVMTKYLDLVLNMRGFEGVKLLRGAIEEAQETGDEERVEKVASACDYIISFVEEFVEQARAMDDEYKKLLGKIMKAMAGVGSERLREDKLDEVLDKEKDNFTPGFLRHIENECGRIMGSQVVSPESAKLLQTMQLVQTRVVEELGKGLGEGALVLNQILGYDDKAERLAVLEAGLTVRGLDFARELSSLTDEALEGFESVPGGADPELVARVTEINGRIKYFIETSGNR